MIRLALLAAVAHAPAPVDPIVDAFHERAACPGVTVGYALPDGTSGSASAGVAFTETGTAMTAEHRMMAGSTGKTFFAALTLQLVADGVLDLDATIATWVGDEPWLAEVSNGADLTLRHLLNHTSGIPRYVTRPGFVQAMVDDPDRRWEPAELLAFVGDDEPLFAVGAGWAYADTNFIVVAMVIEQVTGDSCYNQIDRRLLRPHGLHDVVPTASRDVIGLAGGYVDPQRNLMRLTEPNVVRSGRYVFNPQFEWAGGGFATTPRDLARWGKLLYSGDVLTDEMQSAMRATVEAKLGPGSRYGLGVMQRPSDLGVVLGHAGYFPGYLTDLAYYTEHDLAIAVQVNTTKMSRELNPPALQRLLDECARALLATD